MSRRTFLIGGLGTAAALSTGTLWWLKERGYEVDPGPPRGGPRRPPVTELAGPAFDDSAHAVLTVLIDQLFPGDPAIGLPNGSDAGVVIFLDRACRDRGLRAVRADVLKLCRDLDLRARRQHGHPYVEATAEQRGALLAAVSRNEGRTGRYQPQRALQTTLRIGLEGYLGHPSHGGNRDARVWEALDIPMPRSTSPGGHVH